MAEQQPSAAVNPGAVSIAASQMVASQVAKRPAMGNPAATFSTLGELKRKEPEAHQFLMKMMAQGIVNKIKHKSDHVLKALREIRLNAQR